ncbi:uncharacterized protein LOC120666189 [Panicum virgatum]|uniref:DUF3615 domain-containing protein n=1 Tax=Panicum virgatum TaxID=38727 RepID=A0A8T0U9L6_PANVG|nr:uncharacterized protein LOC120666189 [Panicum virgatum]KAG2620801.1 hypothetical protein PVAP13_3NG197900 [Panicum virgatum]KAG2620802.1 hypothetical protein PVAP13_3NG197900 [Panicum virgatum]
MSVDDCIVPLPTPLSEGASLLKAAARCGSLSSLSELDLYATAADDLGAASAWCGDTGKGGCTVGEFLNRLAADLPGTRSVPSRYHLAISSRDGGGHHLRPLIPSRDDSGLNLRLPALAKENPHGQGSAETFSALSLHESKDALTGKPEQRQTSEVAASRTASRGRYARSKAGWASKERSTPEGYNREKHAWQFEPPFPNGMDTSSIIDAYKKAFAAPHVVRPPKKKKSPEERKAIREKKIIQSERASLHHVETALRKYNRANTTTFVLDEITVKCLFFEFGGPCYHYNFTAKPENHHSADGSTKLFFSEINCPLRSEKDVLLCCIVGEKDAGHCHACEDYRPTMVHPSSRAYGGGNTTAIDYPDDDSSDSDY